MHIVSNSLEGNTIILNESEAVINLSLTSSSNISRGIIVPDRLVNYV